MKPKLEKKLHRDPTIHIKESDLIKVLEELTIKEVTARRIIEVSAKYAIRDRYTIKKSSAGKLEKLLSSSEASVEKFNGILYSLRLDKGFKGGLQHIKKTDKDYPLLKEIASNAFHFVKEFGITPVEDGLQSYCNLGLDLMNKKYALSKFKYYHDKICELYTSYEVISNDVNRKETMDFYLLWDKCITELTGTAWEVITTNPNKYVHFVYARQEADKYKADYGDWIQAQFHELAFLDDLPELSQFHGIPAFDRYKKYMAKKGKQDKRLDEEFEDEGLKEYHKLLRANQ